MAYHYYEWDGLGPLAGTLSQFIHALLPVAWGSKAVLLALVAGVLLLLYRYSPKQKQWIIWSILPLFLYGIWLSPQLLWVLPLYLTVYLLRNKIPLFAGALAAFATLVGIHPLLSMLTGFYSSHRRDFLIGIFIGALLGLLLPFITYSPSQYGTMLTEWYSAFRSPIPPNVQEPSTPSYSLMLLLRYKSSLSPRIQWLLLVNLFHILLLPTLRHGLKRQEVAPLFLGGVLTFIGFTSEWSHLLTIALPLTGIAIWSSYSQLYPKWLSTAIQWVMLLWAYGCTLLWHFLPYTYLSLTPTICYASTLLLGSIQLLQVIELWKQRSKRKKRC